MKEAVATAITNIGKTTYVKVKLNGAQEQHIAHAYHLLHVVPIPLKVCIENAVYVRTRRMMHGQRFATSVFD